MADLRKKGRSGGGQEEIREGEKSGRMERTKRAGGTGRQGKRIGDTYIGKVTRPRLHLPPTSHLLRLPLENPLPLRQRLPYPLPPGPRRFHRPRHGSLRGTGRANLEAVEELGDLLLEGGRGD